MIMFGDEVSFVPNIYTTFPLIPVIDQDGKLALILPVSLEARLTHISFRPQLSLARVLFFPNRYLVEGLLL